MRFAANPLRGDPGASDSNKILHVTVVRSKNVIYTFEDGGFPGIGVAHNNVNCGVSERLFGHQVAPAIMAIKGDPVQLPTLHG
jgi:hypothetical protein